VEFYIDGQYLGSDSNTPWSLSTTIPSSVSRGVHTLKAVAYDDIDNSGSDTVTIQLSAEAGSENLELIDPKNGQTIERKSETYTVVVSLKAPETYRSVSVYAEDLSTGSTSLAGQTLDPESPFLTFEWALPASGTWALSARAISDDGSTELSTAGVLVEIVPADSSSEEPASESTEGEETSEEENIFIPETDLNLF
jgi:hypothetical protein